MSEQSDRKPRIHLICNAHLDPVWQWRWEEGCAEALATFGNAVQLLKEHDHFIFNHNESLLYMWIKKHDPGLFDEIVKLADRGRWCISGGWYLQPDLNMPDTESLIRHIILGRRFFKTYFNAEPIVAYNFDSFGHSGGLPQILKQSGYKMYIHMRPDSNELELPADLYRWKGVDGSEILTYRISVGPYHTERDNIRDRLEEGRRKCLVLNRDVPVFWGLGDHGGGATRRDLEIIDEFISKETEIEILHSTPDLFYRSIKEFEKDTPVVEGDLQRVFTGSYTSLSRLKRGARQSLSRLIQTESLQAMLWWLYDEEFPLERIDSAWRKHLFNDFHDILPGSCTEPAEKDALDLYGQVSNFIRSLNLDAAVKFNRGTQKNYYMPVTVLNSNPHLKNVPVEFECMFDYRPPWTGDWHLRLFKPDGTEIACQEEQPEALLPFHKWRRKICFLADLPAIGSANYYLKPYESKTGAQNTTDIESEALSESHADSDGMSYPGIQIYSDGESPSENKTAELKQRPAVEFTVDPEKGLITGLFFEDNQILNGPLFLPLVIKDEGDAWGTDCWSYRDIIGQFDLIPGSFSEIETGPVRTITESVFSYNQSKIVQNFISYPNWPVLEFRLRIHWNEEKKRLKLAIPTKLSDSKLLCEVPGGAIVRPDDGEEHVHGRWFCLRGTINNKETALAVINSGQHGLDYKNGEVRLSVLRSSAYCHERGMKLDKYPTRKFMDQGIHDVRLLVMAGGPENVLNSIGGLADYLTAPPVVYAHLPVGSFTPAKKSRQDTRDGFFDIEPGNIRLLACKPSYSCDTLIVRLQETIGKTTNARLRFLEPALAIALSFNPFEIKTIRIGKDGNWREVDMIAETASS